MWRRILRTVHCTEGRWNADRVHYRCTYHSSWTKVSCFSPGLMVRDRTWVAVSQMPPCVSNIVPLALRKQDVGGLSREGLSRGGQGPRPWFFPVFALRNHFMANRGFTVSFYFMDKDNLRGFCTLNTEEPQGPAHSITARAGAWSIPERENWEQLLKPQEWSHSQWGWNYLENRETIPDPSQVVQSGGRAGLPPRHQVLPGQILF